MRPRNHAFDLLCGICILRMLTLHVAGYCGWRGDVWVEKMMAWTFFFMSFFFFKAGYFNKTVNGNARAYFVDRTKRLLVPYISWAAIGNLVWFALMLINLPLFQPYLEKRLEWSHLWMHSRPWGNPPVWFLFSFYAVYLLMHLVGKVRGLSYIVLFGPFLSYWLFRLGNPLWMGLDNVFLAAFFFFLGHLWHQLLDRLNRLYPQQEEAARATAIVLSAVLIGLFIYLNRHLHGDYDMSLNQYVQNPWGAVLNSALALCGASGLLLSLPVPRVPVLCYIGQHSMVYFVLHYVILNAYSIVGRLFHQSMRGHWNDFIFCMALILVTCTWLVPYIERVPWLSGRFPTQHHG